MLKNKKSRLVINLNMSEKIEILNKTPGSVSVKYGLRTADCGLRTTDCGLGIKYGLGIKCGLRTEYKTRTRYKTRTTDYVYKNSFRR